MRTTKRRVLLGRVSMPEGYGRVTGIKQHDLCLETTFQKHHSPQLHLLVWNRINTDVRVWQHLTPAGIRVWTGELPEMVKAYLRAIWGIRKDNESVKALIPAYDFERAMKPQPYTFEGNTLKSTSYDNGILFAQNPH